MLIRSAWLSPGREYAVLEIDTGPRRLVIGRYSRPFFWFLWAAVVITAAAFYYPKAADQRSAFVRWQPQVLKFWDGVNIYDKMYFPNPPIMPITLYPLMTLPPVAAAMSWFLIKAALTTITFLICFDVVKSRDRPLLPPFFQTAILVLSLRPILGDLHHGNINLLILFLLATMFQAWRKGYDTAAGLLLGLAISFKVTPALFLPYFLYKKSWRTVAATFLGLALFLVVIPSLVLGPDFNTLCLKTWWHRMLTPFLIEGNASPQEPNQSIVGVLTRLLTEIKPGTNRYDVRLDLNLASLPPQLVSLLVKGVALGLVGLLAVFCRTKDPDRRSPLYLGEISLVVLTMLFVSERSWKHHFVTLVFPYTYLVYELYAPGLTLRSRYGIAGALVASFLLMASTSSEFGGLFAEGKGHDIAQYYGMFMWAAVVLYAAVAWRLRVGQSSLAVAAATPGRDDPAPNRKLSPVYKTLGAG
ncbi:MAG: glycosyltransferase family 87 protein [Paludisphaera borealis]|uniref:glycosyltransferase family 87 protein n=1 Tax=Paludisphaera borealis TaxID=1387353 RepID=UPI00284159A3|nr:glycosyltransferase family 87 protein [Paludisphaera borealis]MDR3621767.1 glycosyltransferase family 87 protein [Paludisphaera borealis]